MRAVVTGGAGFIGSHLTERLMEMGHEVIVMDDLSAGYLDNIPKGVKGIYRYDIADIERYSHILQGTSVLFHLAASKKNICLNDPVKDLRTNGQAAISICRACLKEGVQRIIHFSTGSVIGESKERVSEDSPCRPVSLYGISKLAGENYMNYYSKYLRTTIIRPHHVYGSRQEDKDGLGGVIAIFHRRIKEGLPVKISGDGTQRRLFTHVSSIVDAAINAWLNDVAGIFNVATNETRTINELALMMGAKEIEMIDAAEGDIYSFNVDNTESILKLGVKYLSLKEGLKLL